MNIHVKVKFFVYFCNAIHHGVGSRHVKMRKRIFAILTM